MSLVLGAVADDYTGASDLANTLAQAGLRTVQTIGVPDAGLPLTDIDAVVVALKSRSIAADEAVALSRHAAAWLRDQGARHVMFKVCSTFDSTDAGNIGPVMDALREDFHAASVLVTPAFPGTGRTVFMGHLFVGEVPLNESPLKDHPLNPMHDANLVRVLARQSRHPVGLIPFPIVEQGGYAIHKAMEALRADGKRAAIVDAVAGRNLQAIGEAALLNPVSVGASGLGLGLARALIAGRQLAPRMDEEEAAPSVGGKAAMLAGSCSQATLAQIAAIEADIPVLRLDIGRILAGAPVAQEALDWADSRLADGPVLIASSAPPHAVAEFQKQHGREQAGSRIEHCLAEIGAGLVARDVRRLIVAGGETSGAVVDRLGIRAFSVGPEIAPGVPVLRTVSEDTAMLLALKSGNFGGQDFFRRALEMMT
ncbi:MAG TPA: 3-oxo-tetronate kinase [Acidocella sp.]|uniref:3-oxo-tetronate kinase n=1 Tax=Acidocella sp. TaxID=50710 RepID=UPI002D11AF47|nr:3-oxo-tetronate kinase [Acidocella sp.]HVE21446.1 3-oxo-tetronate kinase [Acidocella sp.]